MGDENMSASLSIPLLSYQKGPFQFFPLMVPYDSIGGLMGYDRCNGFRWHSQLNVVILIDPTAPVDTIPLLASTTTEGMRTLHQPIPSWPPMIRIELRGYSQVNIMHVHRYSSPSTSITRWS
jgi:hypothetical protein